MGIKAVKKIDFDKVVNIKFDNILIGFDNYSFIELTPKKGKPFNMIEEDFIRTFESYFNEVSFESRLLIDFYKHRLNEESIKIIESNLNIKEQELLHNILNEGDKDDIYFEIRDKNYIKLLVKLCTRELFFVTFYFTKDKLTIWGNYNLRFPIFYNKSSNINEYLEIAKSNDLF